MTHITDMHGALQAESAWWLFKSPLAGDGGYIVAARRTTGLTACLTPAADIGSDDNSC